MVMGHILHFQTTFPQTLHCFSDNTGTLRVNNHVTSDNIFTWIFYCLCVFDIDWKIILFDIIDHRHKNKEWFYDKKHSSCYTFHILSKLFFK